MKADLLVIFVIGVASLVGCIEAKQTGKDNAGRSDGGSAPSRAATANRPVEPDNTGVNVRDRDHASTTPTDQKEDKEDVKTTAEIRKQVIDAKLSVDARNVKIVTQDGHVTLRGPVKSQEEKQRIEEIAEGVAGADRVDNQLEVKSDSHSE